MALERSSTSGSDSADEDNIAKLLLSGSSELGLPLSQVQLGQFMTYLSELLRWNQKINLTGTRQKREIVIKHFFDSLSPLLFLNPKTDTNWIDVGSGAGFPGLVLKIVSPHLTMTLLEPSQKKAAFLHHLIGLLKLRYVSVINERIEHLRGTGRDGEFDLMTTRALSPGFVLDKGRFLVRRGGKILFFQGRSDKIQWKYILHRYSDVVLEDIKPIQLPCSQAERALVSLRVKEDKQ